MSSTVSQGAGSSDAGFDLDSAWRLNPRVALRPEAFGALAYHFGTRRLSFLKSPELRSVVESLAEFPTAAEALAAADIPVDERSTYVGALQTLAATDMIIEGGQG